MRAPGQQSGTAAVMLSPRHRPPLRPCPIAGVPHVLPEVEEGGGHPAQGLGDAPLLVGVGGAPRGWDGHGEEREAEQRLPRQPVHLDREADPAGEQPRLSPAGDGTRAPHEPAGPCLRMPSVSPESPAPTAPLLLALGVPHAPSTG